MSREEILWEEEVKYIVRCSCPTKISIVFYPFERRVKKICPACGNYVYINEKEKFKEKMRGKIK